MKKHWEGITCFIGERDWLIPGVLELMVFLVFLLLLFCYKASLAASAQILFSGSLVVTSFLLIRIQRAFNKEVRDRDNLGLASARNPMRSLPGNDLVEFTFQVYNPASTIATLWAVHIENSKLRNKSWEIRAWRRESEKQGSDRSITPALARPGETISVFVRASVDKELEEAKKITELKWRFVYQIGNYKKKLTSYEQDVA